MRGTAFFLLLLSATAAAAQSPAVAPLRPYQIGLTVDARPDAALGAGFAEEFAARLTARLEGLAGGLWQVGAKESAAKAEPGSKTLHVAIRPTAEGYRVAAREVDNWTGIAGTEVVRIAAQPARVLDAATRAAFAAVSPVAVVQAADKDVVKLQVHGSALPPRDVSMALVRKGQGLRPVVKPAGAEGKPLAWTMLAADEITPEATTARLASGSGAVPAPSRGASQSLAVGVPAGQQPTSVRLVDAADARQPVAGLDVFESTIGGRGATFVGRSNPAGEVALPSRGGQARVAVVKQGQTVLARLPVVPGGEPEVVAPVATDDKVLAAEAAAAAATDEVNDVIARREMLLARARAKVEEKQLGEAAALVDELKKLPTAVTLAATITQEQTRVAADPAVKPKVEPLFAAALKTLEQRLSPEPINKLVEQLGQGKKQ